ncbi:MAG: hypothetical protein IPG32_19740 [Saprospirales bacterium]|nr:hypothetical protein [Saprospirales bacterium]
MRDSRELYHDQRIFRTKHKLLRSDRKKWRQNWVGSSGDVGIYEETDSRTKGSMQFIARQMDARGAIQLNRMTFTYDPNADTVRQFIESSGDEGQTWTPSFDGLYKRKK